MSAATNSRASACNPAGTKKGAPAETGRAQVKGKINMLNVADRTATYNGDARSLAPKRRLSEIVKPGFVTFTPGDAELVLRECRYERQTRDLTAQGSTHIAVLADIMTRHQWRDYDKLDFAVVGGKVILINGHHRLGAQVASKKAINWIVVLHDCQTMAEVAELYYTFDTNNRVRGYGTILDVVGAADLLGVAKGTADAVFRAVPLIAANFDFAKSAQDPVVNRVIDRRMELVKAFQKEAIDWEKAVAGTTAALRKRLTTQGALAVALMTFRYAKDDADSFWGGVAENDGLKKGDPRHTYVNVLLQGGTRIGTSQATARQAAVAWNAWVSGRELTFIRTTEAPLRILRTPVGR